VILNRVENVLAWARHILAHTPDVEALDAPVLLAHVLGVDRVALIAHPERTLTPAEDARFRALVKRRAAGEPVPYLIGRRAFFDQNLVVTPDVLIPRRRNT
jgi:release factor glutamine methyltransferase